MSAFLEFILNVQSYGASGQAFWNCVLFCFGDRTVRKEMWKWLRGNDAENELLVPQDRPAENYSNRALNDQ